MISSRFPAISCERIPSLPRPVSTGYLLKGLLKLHLYPTPASAGLNGILTTVIKLSSVARRNSGADRLALAEGSRLVALDVLAEVLYFALGAFLVPTQMPHGDFGCGLINIEPDPRSQPDHRASQEHVGEGLGHLPPESVENLGADETTLDGGGRRERHPQRRVLSGHLEHFGRTRTIELEEPFGKVVGQVARHLELRGEGLEVLHGAARKRDLACAAPGGFEVELLVDLVHRLAGEAAVGGQLAPDDGDQAADPGVFPGVIVDDVTPGDAAGSTLRLVGQGTDAGVGEQDGVAREVRPGDDVVGLVQEVLYLVFVGGDVVQVSLVADIGRADQVPAVPRHDKVRTAVPARLHVERLSLRGSREGIDDQVAPFGAPDHALLGGPVEIQPPQHLVHPRTGDVERHGRVRPVLFATEDVGELDTGHVAVLDDEALDLGVVEDDGAVLVGGDSVLDGYPLGVFHLPVVVEGGASQALGVQAGLAFDGFFRAQHPVVSYALVEREDVIGDHAEPDHERAVLGVLVDGDHETQRLHEVRGYVKEHLPIPQGLPHKGDLVVLQVAKTAVDQTRSPLRRPGGDVPLVQEQRVEAAHRGVPGDPGAVDAGPDHDEVERIILYTLRYSAGHELLLIPRAASARCGPPWPPPGTPRGPRPSKL